LEKKGGFSRVSLIRTLSDLRQELLSSGAHGANSFQRVYLFIFAGRLKAHEQTQRKIEYEKNENKNTIKRLEKSMARTLKKRRLKIQI